MDFFSESIPESKLKRIAKRIEKESIFDSRFLIFGECQNEPIPYFEESNQHYIRCCVYIHIPAPPQLGEVLQAALQEGDPRLEGVLADNVHGLGEEKLYSK